MTFCRANFTFTINTQHALLECDIVFRRFVVIPPIGLLKEKVEDIQCDENWHQVESANLVSRLS